MAHRVVYVDNCPFCQFQEGGEVGRLDTLQGRTCDNRGRVRTAGADFKESVAHHPFRPDGDHRVRSHEPPELLIDAKFDPELCGRSVWDLHGENLACIHSGYLNASTWDDARNIRKLGIKLHASGECLMPIANHE